MGPWVVGFAFIPSLGGQVGHVAGALCGYEVYIVLDDRLWRLCVLSGINSSSVVWA